MIRITGLPEPSEETAAKKSGIDLRVYAAIPGYPWMKSFT